MNEIGNKFLLVVDKFMPEMYLKQSGFTYSACGPFTKNKQKKDWEIYANGNTDYIYKSDLEKDCFHYDMAYGKFKALNKSDKVLRDKVFEIVSNRKYDGQQED